MKLFGYELSERKRQMVNEITNDIDNVVDDISVQNFNGKGYENIITQLKSAKGKLQRFEYESAAAEVATLVFNCIGSFMDSNITERISMIFDKIYSLYN